MQFVRIASVFRLLISSGANLSTLKKEISSVKLGITLVETANRVSSTSRTKILTEMVPLY